MDRLKARSFIKELIYDLDTVQYLLDYARLKETLAVIDRIFFNIDQLRANQANDLPADIFAESFWANKLPDNLTLSQIKGRIHDLAHQHLPVLEEDLSKINYAHFIKDFFNWSDANISKLRRLAKSPLQQGLEKWLLLGFAIALGLYLGINSSWLYLTRDWGLNVDFYKGTNFEQFLFTSTKKTIDFSNAKSMDIRLPLINFSALGQGNLLTPQDGQYTISEVSDDGAKITIDGKVLINDWKSHAPMESSQSIFLSKGTHRITLEYYQNLGAAVLKLYWAFGGHQKEIIPAANLRH